MSDNRTLAQKALALYFDSLHRLPENYRPPEPVNRILFSGGSLNGQAAEVPVDWEPVAEHYVTLHHVPVHTINGESVVAATERLTVTREVYRFDGISEVGDYRYQFLAKEG